jgi:hypothetical protein
MTKEQQAARAGGSSGGHDHEHGPFDAPLTKLFAATTALLLGLLLVGQFYNRRGAENAEKK